MTDTVEILPRPHLRDAEEVKAARARIYERIRKLAHDAHEIDMEIVRWQAHPLPRAEDRYLSMLLDSVEAMRRKPRRCSYPGPEPKIMEAAE